MFRNYMYNLNYQKVIDLAFKILNGNKAFHLYIIIEMKQVIHKVNDIYKPKNIKKLPKAFFY